MCGLVDLEGWKVLDSVMGERVPEGCIGWYGSVDA